jgi:hypothetical protein
VWVAAVVGFGALALFAGICLAVIWDEREQRRYDAELDARIGSRLRHPSTRSLHYRRPQNESSDT